MRSDNITEDISTRASAATPSGSGEETAVTGMAAGGEDEDAHRAATFVPPPCSCWSRTPCTATS